MGGPVPVATTAGTGPVTETAGPGAVTETGGGTVTETGGGAVTETGGAGTGPVTETTGVVGASELAAGSGVFDRDLDDRRGRRPGSGTLRFVVGVGVGVRRGGDGRRWTAGDGPERVGRLEVVGRLQLFFLQEKGA